MQLAPITIGLVIAKIVAFGWITVPHGSSRELKLEIMKAFGPPEPIVISPFKSTSWQTTALEWIANLSFLQLVRFSRKKKPRQFIHTLVPCLEAFLLSEIVP